MSSEPHPLCPVLLTDAWGSHQGYILASDIMRVLHSLQWYQVLRMKISHHISRSNVSCRDKENQQQNRDMMVHKANNTHFRVVSSINSCSLYSQQSEVGTTPNLRYSHISS